MQDSQNGNRLPEELLKSLSAVTIMVQNVLSDIKEHSTSLAILKTKLEDLTENVGELAHVIRDGNGKGSMVTRVALAEKSLEDMEEQINDMKDDFHSSVRDMKHIIESAPKKSEEEERKQKRERSIARWQFWGTLLAAFTAVGFQIFGMIIHK